MLAIGVLGALVACGGGGGGGNDGATASSQGTSGGGGFQVTLDRSVISYDYFEDAPANTTVRLHASVTGTVPEPLYVGTTVEGEGLSHYIPLYLTATGADIDVSANATQAGVYGGKLKFYACADTRCTQPIGGTPLTVTYTVTVHKGLKVPTSLSLAATSGQVASGKLAIQWPEGQSVGSVTVQPGADWLSVDTVDADGATLSATSLRSGTYNALLTVTAGTHTAQLPVSYVVTAPATGEFDLRSSTGSLTFSTVESDSPAPQSIQVDLPTWGGSRAAVQYSIKDGSNWLQVTPTAQGAQISVTAARLTQGPYQTEVLVSLPGITSTVLHVPVALSVGMDMVRPADLTIDVRPGTTGAALAGSVPIQQRSGAPVGWQARSGAAWLKLSPSSSAAGPMVGYAVDLGELAKQPNGGTQSTTVTVTPAVASVTPVSFNVTISKHLAETHGVGPYVLLSGRPQTLRVSGQGFNSVPDLSTALEFDGPSPTSIQLINDRSLVLQLPALAAGTYRVGLHNAVDAATTTQTVSVVDPVTYSYQVVPTGELSYCLSTDPVRQSVYVMGMSSQRVMRYHFDGGSWVRSTVSVPGLLAVGMAPDGSSLVTQSSSGQVSLLDPDALTTTYSVQSPLKSAVGVGCSIPSTNDGRSWLVMTTGWNQLMVFDHRSRTLSTPDLGGQVSNLFHGGPYMNVARNGERMVMTPSMSISPMPPMAYMDTSEGILKSNPIGFTDGVWAVSGDGSRMMNGWQVRDSATFGLMGSYYTSPAAGYRAGMSVISDDGRRIYVLALPDAAFTSTDVTDRPRVYVFDSSKAPDLGSELPMLGYFDVADFATCTGDRLVNGCQPLDAGLRISPDGQTIFYVGGRSLIVLPIPPESSLKQAASALVRATAKSASKMVIQPWPVAGR